ncbi:ATP-binding protein [Photobacterium sagamiensis]|uniref:anti-phage-associated helicase HerA n=1 Tax=Photobacterium sagamiensis TaxID=2910241 RepID=UPI003D14DC15
MTNKTTNAQVIGIFPDKVKVAIIDIEKFTNGESIKVGSYIRITDNEDCVLIAAIENFSIETTESGDPKYLIEAFPLGVIDDGKFIRGGDALTIPPTGVAPATEDDIRKVFEDSIEEKENFSFCKLLSNQDITVPVNGNKFFNKHIAIVGSTGSGKSHTISKILQKAISEKNIKSGEESFELNNSHTVIFDIHSEYKTAFPKANVLDVSNLSLPYWLLNSDELEEILLDTGERDNYNQSAIFRRLVTENKRKHNPTKVKVFYDSPIKFSIEEVLNAIYNIKSETINYKNESRYMVVDDSYELTKDGKTNDGDGILLDEKSRLDKYFKKRFQFHQAKGSNISKGSYADGSLNKFFSRFESKVAQDRLSFIFNKDNMELTLEKVLASLIGYSDNKSNVTIIDLSGVPFEVLSITVSLISRLLFEYGYYYKVLREGKGEKYNNDAPLLLVYEEAHKYVPRSDLSKFRASKTSIERIAKEGRKYGVTLLLSSQRPAEISETIFSQCSNFLAMRLTNPNDQNYVSRLLPDTLGRLKDKLPSLGAGEALLIGESVIIPSLVKIDRCVENEPSSNDIPYYELWKEKWKDIDFIEIENHWLGD